MSFLRNAFSGGRPEPIEFTFKRRVMAFWTWFAEVADRFHQAMDERRGGELTEEVSEAVDRCLPGMAWVFGPGENPGEHSFTLSGEGVQFKQLLAHHWLQLAPKINGWVFYADRQPTSEPGGFTIRMDNLDFGVLEFWVTPEIDEENEFVDLTVWHPLAEKADEGLCHTALFLVLDEILGEMGTCRWIGSIEFNQKKLAESMPISELKEFVEITRAERGWEFRYAWDSWSTYRIPEDKRSNKPRLDTISGMCGSWQTFRDYLQDPDEFEDPFREFHAEWIYLSFPTSILPAGKEVDAREAMGDAIVDALAPEHGGILLGGSLGATLACIDLLIFDGVQSRQIIREAAQKAGFPADTRIEFLDAKERHRGGPLFA
jgi:hypothetical protein